jgi:predicted phage tail protein
MKDNYIDAPGSYLLRPISGAGGGGKGGGGHTPVEADNTLRSAAVARIVEVISEGPIEGLAGGAQGIYINDTPLLQADGTTYNFPRSQWDYRVGLPSQDYMPGFPNVQSETAVNTAVSIASNNIVRTMATSTDIAMVTMQLPQGLTNQNISTGDLNGSSVSFRIDTRLGTGTYTTYGTYTITGKTTTAYEAQYRVQRPAGTGAWSIRVTRITADPAANEKNQTTWARYTEVQEIKVTYPNAAVVGIAIDAESVGNTIPKRGYLVKGLLVKIPSNYNPLTRVYTGTWNGLFTTSTVAVSNPVWTLYDLLTNSTYGAGISPSDLDKQSFYDASVYCDALVSYTSSSGTQTEPRFTFDARIADRPEMWKLAKDVCGAMNANLMYWNGKWTLIQDRPTSVSKIVTNANVIDGYFNYPSSGLYERHTAVNVRFNDKYDRYLERTATYEDSAGIAKYGYNTMDLAAFGATTEGQAIRAAKWVLDTELNATELCEFQMSLNGFDIAPGDVISINDQFRYTTGTQVAGKVSSYTALSTSVVLDRACNVTTGSTITALLADGKTLETRTISGSGTLSTVTITSAFSTGLFTQADFTITTSSISPRPFRVIDITVPEPGIVKVKATEYDSTKYARVESGVTLPSTSFTNVGQTLVPAPTGLTFSVEGLVTPLGVPKRFLRASWTAPSSTYPVNGYVVTYARDSYNRESLEVGTTTALISADEDGTYNVSVYAVGFDGNSSGTALNGSYVVTSNGTTADPTGFGAPINLVAVDSNGTTWSQDDLVFKWADNGTNTRPAVDYKVEIYTTSSSLLRTEYITAPQRQYTYDLAKNINDGAGTPRGALLVKVYGRDPQGAFSSAATATFTNPAPVAVAGVTVTAAFNSANVRWTANTENDVAGYHVWRGTTSTFIPSSSTWLSTETGTSYSDGGLSDSTTYYYKVAAIDRFNFAKDGTGLNVSTAGNATTFDPNNTNEYQLTGVTWTPNSGVANRVAWTACTAVKTSGTSAGSTWSISAGNATWTGGVLYIYYTEGATTLSSTTSITTAVATNKIIVATYRGGTDLEVGNGKAYMDGSFIIAGTVGASQLVTGTAVITQGAQIASATIGNAHITGQLTADKIDTRGLSIKDAAGNVILASGSPLAYTNVSGGPPSNATNGATFGVNIGGQITSSNVSTYIASLAVGQLQIAGNSVSGVAAASTTDVATSVSFNVPSNCAVLVLQAAFGTSAQTEQAYAAGSDKSGGWYTTTVPSPSYGQITFNGSVLADGKGSAMWAYSNPGPGTYTIGVNRSGSDTGAYGGVLAIVAHIGYR